MDTTEIGGFRGRFFKWGPPGCGKTTWIKQIVQWCVRHYGSQSVLLTSLTRTAALEIAKGGLPVPPEAIGTTHAHCWRALGGPQIAEAHLDEWNDYAKRYAMSSTAYRGLDEVEEPNDTRKEADHLLEMYGLLRARMVPREQWPERVKVFAQTWEAFKAEGGLLDFTDLIETALREIPVAPGNPRFLIVDECQDLSRLEFALLDQWGAHTQAFILTGDIWQALFTWRGADPNIFAELPVPAGASPVLEQSYRVPKAVHAEAMRWIRQLSTYRPLRYFPTEHDGAVIRLPSATGGGPTYTQPDALIPIIERAEADDKTILILASCGYMLDPLKQLLRREGVSFHNPWRRSRLDWNPLKATRGLSIADRILAYLRPSADVWGAEAHRWTGADMKAWTELVSKDVFAKGAKKAIKALPDEHAVTFDELSQWCADYATFKAWDASDWQWLAQHILPGKQEACAYPLRLVERHGAHALRDTPRIIIGTVHSSKGGEADRVVLFPDLSIAGAKEWLGAPEQRDNVVRMFYVGMTRAIDTLYLCQPATNRRVSWGEGEYGDSD